MSLLNEGSELSGPDLDQGEFCRDEETIQHHQHQNRNNPQADGENGVPLVHRLTSPKIALMIS